MTTTLVVVGIFVCAGLTVPAVFLVGWAIEARDRRRNQALLVRKAGR